jgi:hypothetical protein
MPASRRKTLNVPPFPPLKWDDYFWTGTIVLPAWAGFQTRQGPYGRVNSAKSSDGSVRLYLKPPGDDKERRPPTAEQIAAYQHLTRHGKVLHDAILRRIFEEYPSWRDEWLDAYGLEEDEDSEEAQEVPPIQRPEQLRDLMGLSIVHIMSESRHGLAFVGFEFGCVWETEHGLGIMTHGDRILAVGQADTSFRVYRRWMEEGASP